MKLKIYIASAVLALFTTHADADEVAGRQRQDQIDQEMRQAQANEAQFWADYENQLAADHQRRQAALGADNSNRAQDWWGSMAVNSETGIGAWNANHLSGSDSLQEIQNYCQHNACNVVAVFKNTCVAAAQNSKGALFWADDVKEDIAVKNAIGKCKLDQAVGTSCKASKDLVACSGYNYQKYRGKLSNFNRGGLMGVIWPKFSGIPEVQPPGVIYKPSVAMLTSQTESSPDIETAFVAQVATDAKKSEPRWAAMASSQSGEFGLGLAVTESIAKADALRKCAAPDCAVRKSYQGNICIAAVTGSTADGKEVGGMDALETKELAEATVLNGCKASGWLNCKVIISECIDTAQ
jgi:hypothetical protein